MPQSKRKGRALTADFWRKGRDAETAIHVPGGKIVIPGDGKNDTAILCLLSQAIAKGTARVEKN